jgi:hypothetical protein
MLPINCSTCAVTAPEDTIPTHYRLNGRRGNTRTFFDAGVFIAKPDFVEVQLDYLMCDLLAYLLGVIYGRVVNSPLWLDWLRVNIVLVAQKRLEEAHERAAERMKI